MTMPLTFPTFTRAWHCLRDNCPASRGEASLSDSTAVLRLVAACQATGVGSADLLEAWGKESGIRQGPRLRRLADCLRDGHSLEDAIAKVPGVVRDDHGVAVMFGSRLNLLGPTITDCLSRSSRPTSDGGRRRFLLGYFLVILLIFLPVHALIGLKILPMYAQIFTDFGTGLPATTTFGITAMNVVSQVFLWAVMLALALGLLWTFSLRVRRTLRWCVAGKSSRAFALDLLGTALSAGRPFEAAAAVLANTHWSRSLCRRLAAVDTGSPGRQLRAARLIGETAGPFVDESIANGHGGSALHQLADRTRMNQRLTGNRSTELLAPALAAGMGMIVAIELLAVFTPLLKLIGGWS